MASKSLLIGLFTFSAAYGCGLLPPGQERTINYNISGFKLPAAMVFSKDMMAPPLAPFISTTEEAARTFIQRLIKQLVDDVLYEQGRGSGLSYDVISMILGQLDVSVKYEPLECVKVFSDTNGAVANSMMGVINCQIIGGTVMHICEPAAAMCMLPMELKSVPSKYLSVTGSVKTTNIIMANWSKEMWQIVLKRVIRRLALGPLASNFLAADITLS